MDLSGLFSASHFGPGMGLGRGLGNLFWGGYTQEQVDAHNARVKEWELEAVRANFKLSSAKQQYRELSFQTSVQLGQKRAQQYSEFEKMMDQNILKQAEINRKALVAKGKIQVKGAETQGSGGSARRARIVAASKSGRDWHNFSGASTYGKRAKWQVEQNMKRLGTQYDRDMQSHFRQSGAGVPVLLSAMPKLKKEPFWSRALKFSTDTLLPLIGTNFTPKAKTVGEVLDRDKTSAKSTPMTDGYNYGAHGAEVMQGDALDPYRSGVFGGHYIGGSGNVG